MLKVRVNYTAIVIVSLAFKCLVSGAVNMSCDSLNTLGPTNATCTCSNTAGSGVQWYKNRIYIAECYIVTGRCSGDNPGYTFTVDTSKSIYTCTMTGNVNSYSECDVYTCTDLADTSIQKSETFSFKDLPYTPIVNEPARDHMNGSINTTTDCLYNINVDTSTVEVQWFAVMVNGVEESFDPKNPVISKDSSTCQPCNHKYLAKLHAGFDHEENGTTEAKIRIVINYGGIKLNTTSENMYFINVAKDANTDDDIQQFPVVISVLSVAIVVAIVAISAYFFKIRQKPFLREFG